MFMFPEAQGPKLDKTTVDHIVSAVLKYAGAQYEAALNADKQFLAKMRLSRALGALSSIKQFALADSDWEEQLEAINQDCDELWAKLRDTHRKREYYRWGDPDDDFYGVFDEPF